MPRAVVKIKKARNAVTSALRRAKPSYFTNMFEEVKKTSAFWNLIYKATNRSARNRAIAPLKRTDGSFCFNGVELIAFTVFLLQLSRARGRITHHAPNLQ